eukprot:TRINITY_DN3686_c1_g1_i1.p1 TRINITY_DN3686_c1_g1~~TRINITY_DN3686_c1_g1_i1.p1  ORF type:complete len:194 (+),score=41.41 TRINITY_DN3686_c1_g1_i1:95-676(+)
MTNKLPVLLDSGFVEPSATKVLVTMTPTFDTLSKDATAAEAAAAAASKDSRGAAEGSGIGALLVSKVMRLRAFAKGCSRRRQIQERTVCAPTSFASADLPSKDQLSDSISEASTQDTGNLNDFSDETELAARASALFADGWCESISKARLRMRSRRTGPVLDELLDERVQGSIVQRDERWGHVQEDEEIQWYF